MSIEREKVRVKQRDKTKRSGSGAKRVDWASRGGCVESGEGKAEQKEQGTGEKQLFLILIFRNDDSGSQINASEVGGVWFV